MNTNPNILNGSVCPYCGKKTEHIPDTGIYKFGGFGGMIYVCHDCKAHVGCHKSRPTEALGRLANKELRQAKMQAHEVFDALWRRKMVKKGISKTKARNMAYHWLSKEIKIPIEFCHIAMFDIQECEMVVKACEPFVRYQTKITGNWATAKAV